MHVLAAYRGNKQKEFKIKKNFVLSWRIRTAALKTSISSKPFYSELFD